MAALDTFVKQLADSGILTPGKLENFVPPKAHPQSVDELVAELVKHKELTPFQATQVKAGKVRALILGEYTLVDRIGAGGMGQVFKAVHRRMDRTVAIKMLPPAMTKDAAALARFEREVRAAAKLSHPHIVAAYDAGQAGPSHFLVMEYVDGKDLSAIVKKDGPLPVGKAVNYLLQAARGLEFAHGEGVVHRDIKPANLLLDKKGVVKILDMGLARVAGATESGQMELTGSGMIMGTVDFMSPEQAIATKHADHRADIYSLGITLYYLLSGKMPYAGDTAIEKLMAHQTQPIPNLQDVQTTVPKQLDAVFKKMVAKKVDDRYQSMGDVIEALEELGIGTSITKKSEVASTLALSPEQKKKLAATGKKNALSSITEKVASKKTRGLLVKVVGGTFGTLIAPLLVFYLIRYLEKKDEPAKPPVVENVAGTLRVPLPAKEKSENPRVDPLPASAGQQVGNGTRSVPATLVAPFDAAQAKAGQDAWAKYLGTQVETTNRVGMKMIVIPPGEFQMGSSDEQVAAALKAAAELKADPFTKDRIQKAERPRHRVAITRPFLLGATEVTFRQFKQFVEASKYVTEAENDGGANAGNTDVAKVKGDQKGKNWQTPGYPVSEDQPVTQVTWSDAVQFCNWLSEQQGLKPCYRRDGHSWFVTGTGNGYRLPTEAEWEYACRAGSEPQYSFGDDWHVLTEHGWFNQNSDGRPRSAGLKLPNGFGLYDMHGNVWEWCQDYFDEAGYGTGDAKDPHGPTVGSARVVRGGGWRDTPLDCRAASRGSAWGPSSNHRGFRVVRVLDATGLTTAGPSASPAKPTKPWQTPEFQQWLADAQKLPAEKQLEAVSKKLMELNPGFDGKLTEPTGAPRIENRVVTGLSFNADEVTDLSPLRALAGLKHLNCRTATRNGKLSDLSPLQGLPLEMFTCAHNNVSDLSPLEGMPLAELLFSATKVTDLSPLRGMPLASLNFQRSPVTDLSPLRGMQLNSLNCAGSNVSDLSPIAGMPLVTLLTVKPEQITKGIDSLRRMSSLQTIGIDANNKWPAAEFWKKYDAGDFGKPAATKKLAYLDAAFQQWVKATQALPAEKQIDAVSKKLMELNPGFDGKVTDRHGKGTPKIENAIVTEFAFAADNVTDISPVRALAGLNYLFCNGSTPGKPGRLSDLSPLRGMSLTTLNASISGVSDLSPLAGMPLKTLVIYGTKVSDLSPLKGMQLSDVQVHATQISDLSPLRGMPLTYLNCGGALVTDLSPLQGSSLTQLYCGGNQLVSLSPLKGLPLTYLHCINCPVSDLSPLQECKHLKTLNVTNTKVTPATVAALQKALPNCKIEWDDPAKATTSATAPASKK